MKKVNILIFGICMILLWTCSPKTTALQNDTQSSTQTNKSQEGTFSTGGTISFNTANDRYEANGKFNKWHFTKVYIKKGNIESLNADLSIDLTSIWEKSDGLTDHLKAPDFFNIAQFTTATIQIRNVEKTAGTEYEAQLQLNMKGLSQTLPTKFTVTNTNPLHVKGSAKVDRVLFGLGSDKMGLPQFVDVQYDTDIPH